MSNTRFYGYIRNINGQAVYCIQGLSDNSKNDRNRHIECYREYQNGQALCRNLYYKTFTHSFFCCFPGEKDPYYTRNNKIYVITQEWDESWTYNIYTFNKASEKDIKAIVSQYPDFIYTARKMLKVNPKTTAKELFEALKIWKEHKEIEFFFASGLFDACFKKSLYTMKKEEQRTLCKYVFTHKNVQSGIRLSHLKFLIKYNIPDEEIYNFLEFLRCNPSKRTVEFYNYLKKQIEKTGGIDCISTMADLYKDYLKFAKEIGVDLKDPYHNRPTDLLKRHQRLLEQANNKKEAERIAQIREKQKNFIKAVKKYKDFYTKVDGYEIFIPQNVEEVIKQAGALRQCLVYCDYVGKISRKNCILVFIQKEGNPIATAEIYPSGKIGQFRGYNNCNVAPKETALFDKWLDTHPIKWRVYNRKAA